MNPIEQLLVSPLNQMKVIEQYPAVVLFVLLYSVLLAFESANKTLSVTIQMKAIEQYFAVVLFVLLYSVVLTFESMGTTLKCDYSSDSY